MIAPFVATNQNPNIIISDNNDCPICLVSINDGFTTVCNHRFCTQCLVEALTRNPSCPICRQCNIHNCTSLDNECLLCIAGHNPAIVTPNVFSSDHNLSYSPLAYITYYELKIILAKLLFIFLIQLFAGYQCIKGVITFWAYCCLSLILTIIGMIIISQSPRNFVIYLIQFANRFESLLPIVNQSPHLEV